MVATLDELAVGALRADQDAPDDGDPPGHAATPRAIRAPWTSATSASATEHRQLRQMWTLNAPTVTASNSTQTASGRLVAPRRNRRQYDHLDGQRRTTDRPCLRPATTIAVHRRTRRSRTDARRRAHTRRRADRRRHGGCRNTIVVLIVGGGEGNTHRREPRGQGLDVPERQRPARADLRRRDRPARPRRSARCRPSRRNSGGQYFEVTQGEIEATTRRARRGAGGRARHQHGRAARMAHPTDFNTAPTASLPFGPTTDSR